MGPGAPEGHWRWRQEGQQWVGQAGSRRGEGGRGHGLPSEDAIRVCLEGGGERGWMQIQKPRVKEMAVGGRTRTKSA